MFDESHLKNPPFRTRELFVEARSPEKPCKQCGGIYVILGMDKCVDCFKKECSSKVLEKRGGSNSTKG